MALRLVWLSKWVKACSNTLLRVTKAFLPAGEANFCRAVTTLMSWFSCVEVCRTVRAPLRTSYLLSLANLPMVMFFTCLTTAGPDCRLVYGRLLSAL